MIDFVNFENNFFITATISIIIKHDIIIKPRKPRKIIIRRKRAPKHRE